jgi:hypothetical protein
MDLNLLISRVKNIIISPKTEWDAINNEKIENNSMVINYILPFVLLIAITTLIGGFLSPRIFGFSISYSLIHAVISLIVGIGSVYLSAYIINELATSFGTEKNLNNAFKLVVYSSTPALLASIVANLHWSLGFLNLFGLYSIYLFWLGIEQVMKTPEDKKIGYVIISFLILFGIYLVLGFIFAGLILSSLFTFNTL